MHSQLAAAQEAFLAGDCYARPEAAAAAALAAAGGANGAQQPALLRERFAAAVASGEAAAAGGSTDAGVRLTHLLKALAAANNNVIESRSREWVPLFLAFAAAGAGGEDGEAGAAGLAPAAAAAAGDSDEDEEEEGAEEGGAAAGAGERRGVVAAGIVSGRAWRSGLRDWLAMLAGLKGARGMFQWEVVQARAGGHACCTGLCRGALHAPPIGLAHRTDCIAPEAPACGSTACWVLTLPPHPAGLYPLLPALPRPAARGGGAADGR